MSHANHHLPAAAPRYLQLADSLIRDIANGRYPVGDLLPPELRLCEQYGVSRHTVREAIRRLADMGLISRRQGIGTRVKAKAAQSRYVASLSSIADLFQYTKKTRLKLLSERSVTTTGKLAKLLRCKPGQRWLMFETCRYWIGAAVPISYTEIYVHPAYEGIRERLRDESVWVYGLIEEHYGERIVEVQQQVGAIAIEPRVAKLLRVKPGSPGLHVLRYYLGDGDRLLSMSVNVYAAKRFNFVTRWRLDWERDQADLP